MNISQKYKITVLSPVHIGSGRKLLKGFDFFSDTIKSQTSLYDLDEITELIADNRRAIDELANLDGRDNNIDTFVRKYRLENRLKKQRRCRFVIHSRELLEYIRDGFGNPLIPGSSLKGGIRSAYAHTLFAGLEERHKQALLEQATFQRNAKFAGQGIEKALFGKEPYFDFMKALTLTDAAFDRNALSLGIAQVMSLTRNGDWYWKKGYKDYPMTVALEYIKPNAAGEATIRFNDYFINDEKARQALHFDQKLYPDFKTMHHTINNFSRNLIDTELNFIEDHDMNDRLSKIAGFYDNLRRHFPDDAAGCILRIGWGSGWTSMTGNILEDHAEYLKIFRDKFNMGRNGAQEYPKSRKILMQKNSPDSVMGWIKLEAL